MAVNSLIYVVNDVLAFTVSYGFRYRGENAKGLKDIKTNRNQIS